MRTLLRGTWTSIQVAFCLLVTVMLYHAWRPQDVQAASHWLRRVVDATVSSPVSTPQHIAQDRVSLLQGELQELEQEASIIESTLAELRRLQESDRQQMTRVDQILTDPAPQLDRDNLALSRKALDYFLAARETQIHDLVEQASLLDRQIAESRRRLLAQRADLAREGLTELVADLTMADSTPRQAMTQQYTLLVAGKTADLRECFSERVREAVTDDVVRLGRRIYLQESFADLAYDFDVDHAKGTCIVRSRTGREVTSMVRRDGTWLSDRVWFQ